MWLDHTPPQAVQRGKSASESMHVNGMGSEQHTRPKIYVSLLDGIACARQTIPYRCVATSYPTDFKLNSGVAGLVLASLVTW